MAQNETPWRTAMRDKLESVYLELEDRTDLNEGWVLVEDVLQAGIAAVPDEVAQKEIDRPSQRRTSLPVEKRLLAAKRSKAQQAMTGMKRFGQAKLKTSDEGKKVARWLGADAGSVGEVVGLRERVASLETAVEALEAQVQFLVDRATGERVKDEAEFFSSVGLASVEG